MDYSIHPILKTLYYFPRRQADLTVPNTRRNATFIVPGGGGPINPKGLAAFDREPNILQFQFNINPIADGVPLDQARSAFLVAVDHGLPQTLAFRDDDNAVWMATCVLVADPHHQTASSDAVHTIQASWVALNDYLYSPAEPGTAVYGRYFKYGLHTKYSASAVYWPLNTAWNAITLDNSVTGSAAATTDPVFTLTGPFGTTQPAGAPIYVWCEESNTGFYLFTALADNTQSIEVNLAARRVRFISTATGQAVSTPGFSVLGKPPTQPGYITILPNQVNTIVVFLPSYGTPMATLNGTAAIQWRPKRSL